MSNMIQVIHGEIKQYSLPKTGTISTGETVSGYDILPLSVLESEGWLPLEVDPTPSYNLDTEYIVPKYTIFPTHVTRSYEIKQIPIDPVKLALRKLVKVNDLTEEEINIMVDIYEPYEVGKAYKTGDVFKVEDKLYEVIREHTSQADWVPSSIPTLYKNWNPDHVIPEWTQPIGAHDAYNVGNKVTFQGTMYESLINANVWSPTAYPKGWKVI